MDLKSRAEPESSPSNPPPGRDGAEGEEVSEPPVRPKEFEFSKRTIILIVLAMIAAAALTVEGWYLILNAFVLHDPKDPLTKAGRFLPEHASSLED
jgi:hypothetical protein